MDDYPEEIGMWTIENYQRNQIERGLKDCKDDDIIMISDLDEIPDPRELKNIFEMKELDDKIIRLDFRHFMYYMNFIRLNYRMIATKIVLYKNFNSILNNYKINSNFLDKKVNIGTTASRIRFDNVDELIYIYPKFYGWHFSYLGGFDKFIKKHKSVCEGNNNIINNIEKSKKIYIMLTKIGIYQQYSYTTYIKPDNFYPKYILDNIDKYKHLFNHLDDKNLKNIRYYDSKFFNYFILKPKIFFCKYILSQPSIIRFLSSFIPNKDKREIFRYVMFRKYINKDYFNKKNK